MNNPDRPWATLCSVVEMGCPDRFGDRFGDASSEAVSADGGDHAKGCFKSSGIQRELRDYP